MYEDDQPWVDDWPMWNEPLSKIPAGIDIQAARAKLAHRFNVRPPKAKQPDKLRDTKVRVCSLYRGAG
jgi:hypothetical protein